MDFKQSFEATLDPESLFSQYTVSEVKLIQNRLRIDADAKQEELRQMVGERYRDLLQASTSIIDIASSSKRVTRTLTDTMDSIKSQETPRAPKRQSMRDGGDTHLHALQLLAAHIKLLLDAPEHLWRLIESKKFLSASWLFQLANLVHQTLLRNEDDEIWTVYQISVQEQFPLIERQWDVIKQFRQQIIHKATVALRDFATTPENTCATLLTLHLLDRRPLGEAFSSTLTERTKSFQQQLSSGPSVNTSNGHATDSPNPSLTPKVSIQEVRDATISVFSAVSSTMNALRIVFQETPHHRPLIIRVLEFIQSDSSAQSDLPDELRITTESLLMTLPSSNQLMLLPTTLKDFKPNVNTSSVSSSISQSQFNNTMETWFRKSCNGLQKAMDKWFSDLRTLREVWTIRSSLRKWIGSGTPLEPSEALEMETIFETTCRRRILAIWRVVLSNAQSSFREDLETSIRNLKGSSSSTNVKQFLDSSPTQFMFSSPPLPVISPSSTLVQDSSFQKYQTSLRKQLLGRNNTHDRLLNTLEACARSIKHDLEFILSHVGQEEDGSLAAQFKEEFRVDTLEICQNVMDTLRNASDNIQDSELPCLGFLCRIVNDLAIQSSFLVDLGGSATLDFRKEMVTLQDQIVDRWKLRCVEVTLVPYRLTSGVPHHPPSVLESIVKLNRAVEELGVARDSLLLARLSEGVVTSFISEILKMPSAATMLSHSEIPFLRKLVTCVCGESPTLLLENLDKHGLELDPSTQTEMVLFPRTQLLVSSSLLPYPTDARTATTEETSDKFSALLPYGVPFVDQQYHPAIETAKSSRFGLLLIDNSVLRS